MLTDLLTYLPAVLAGAGRFSVISFWFSFQRHLKVNQTTNPNSIRQKWYRSFKPEQLSMLEFTI